MLVGMDGVVLQVQRLLRSLDQCQPGAIGGLGAGQEGEGGGLLASRLGALLLDQLAQGVFCGESNALVTCRSTP